MGGNSLRKCRCCGKEAHTEEELNLFVKSAAGKHGRSLICKVCKNQQAKEEWKKPNSMKKKHTVAKRYGCSLEEYEERMQSSDVCEICGKEQGDKQGDKLCYDHCHDTMDFRGILCTTCNSALGQLGDNLESIKRVVKYLTKEKINE